MLKYTDGPCRDLMNMPTDLPVFVSVRRSVPVQLVKSNGDKYVGIMTSEGARELKLQDYFRFVSKFEPDAVISVADLPSFSQQNHGECGNGEDIARGLIPRPGGNRVKKMVFRTERWMENLQEYLTQHSYKPAVFAPVLPYVDLRTQGAYIDYVQSLNESGKISGLTLWSYFGNSKDREPSNGEGASEEKQNTLWSNVVDALKERGLDKLVRYNNAVLETPHDLLDQVMRNGSDLFNGDLVTQYTNAGVVLDFVFPAKPEDIANGTIKEIGLNMWDAKYTTDMSFLGEDTPNVTGTHNRAYLHHLLDAHEMTAWVLLQIHNLHVLRIFFNGIRASLAAGTLESDVAAFLQVYGDRVSALQVKQSIHGEEKSRMPKARAYNIGREELIERTRGSSEGQKLNSTRWSKEM